VPRGGWLPPPRSQFLDEIGTKFRRLPNVLGAMNPTVLLGILYDVTGSQKSKMVASNLTIRISRLVEYDSNTILTAIHMSSRSSNPIGLLEIPCELTGS